MLEAFVSTATDDVEIRIDFFYALLHSSAADDVVYGFCVATLLSAVAGAILRQWWHGAIAIPLIAAAYIAFLLLIPVLAFGAPFELPPLREISRPARTMFVVLTVAFVLAFSLRWVAVRSWDAIVNQPRSD